MTRVPTQRIRRWIRGYHHGPEARFSPPVFKAEWIAEANDGLVLSFRDLLEIRFVDAFRDKGVSWKTIREASDYAAEILQTSHPFATRKFKTDGRKIIAQFGRDRRKVKLLDLIGKQYELPEMIAHTLFAGVEFGKGIEPLRWWPMGTGGGVLLDPARSFGQPIVAREGVPTRVLAAAFRAEGNEDVVSAWYEVSRASVRNAVAYEESLAQAA